MFSNYDLVNISKTWNPKAFNMIQDTLNRNIFFYTKNCHVETFILFHFWCIWYLDLYYLFLHSWLFFFYNNNKKIFESTKIIHNEETGQFFYVNRSIDLYVYDLYHWRRMVSIFPQCNWDIYLHVMNVLRRSVITFYA